MVDRLTFVWLLQTSEIFVLAEMPPPRPPAPSPTLHPTLFIPLLRYSVTSATSSDQNAPSTLPWLIFAETSRALALLHQGIGGGAASASSASPPGDVKLLSSAADSIGRAADMAKACRAVLGRSRRHVLSVTEGGAGKGKQVAKGAVQCSVVFCCARLVLRP